MNPLDAELVTAGELVRGLVGLGEPVDPAGATTIERVACDIPVEVAARLDGAEVAVLMSPPRQPILTTVMPVFHRLRITVVRDAEN